MAERDRLTPSVLTAFIPIIALIIMLVISLLVMKLDIDTGGVHIPLILAGGVAAIVSSRLGYPWSEIQEHLVHGITLALAAIMILMVIGVLIGTWMISGIVPNMIYYGLELINPVVFLPTACIICSLVSLSTGSSWSTAGTVGVALVGVGVAQQIPPGLVAGAIISGAYFGDKMSPLSDTTNLAPATVGTELFTHIRHMVYTVTPSMIIALTLYTIIGLNYGGGTVGDGRVGEMLSAISHNFTVSPWFLAVPALVILMVVFKTPALPSLVGGAILGGIVAAATQGSTLREIVVASFVGFTSTTGLASVDSLLSRGGLMSMMNTIALILAALSFGGIMEGSKMLEVVATAILKLAGSVGSLVTATIITCIGMNALTADQYLAIVIPGRMYREAYLKFNLDPKNLSRALEDSATMTSSLIPWNTGGAYMGSVLGVSAFVYAPFAFLNLVNPLISITYGYTGFSMHPLKPEDQENISEK